jgi:hypothetical protein
MEQSLAQLYIERDAKLQLIPEETIIKHLKKLNYYNIDIENLKNNFIKNYLIDEIKNNNYCLDNNYYIIITKLSTILDSDKYKKYIKYLNYCVERSNILINYINNINNFYNNCTNDELLYLGY